MERKLWQALWILQSLWYEALICRLLMTKCNRYRDFPWLFAAIKAWDYGLGISYLEPPGLLGPGGWPCYSLSLAET
jgi:hypothetical protein